MDENKSEPPGCLDIIVLLLPLGLCAWLAYEFVADYNSLHARVDALEQKIGKEEKP